MLRLVLVGSVAVLTILMAVACGGGDSPHINRSPGQQRQL